MRGRDITIIQSIDEETEAYRGGVRAWIPERTPAYRTLPPPVTVHVGEDLRPSSLHWPLSSKSAECISFISTATTLVPSPVERWSSAFKVCMYLAQRHSVIKRQSKMSTQEQSPCNFHHALKLPVLGQEHLGVALQKLKCLKKRLHLSCTHFESCRRW